MTYQFFKTMMRFCFPEKDPESLEEDGSDAGGGGGVAVGGGGGSSSATSSLSRKSAKHTFKAKGHHRNSKESSFYVTIEDKDDVEKMKVPPLSPTPLTANRNRRWR